MHIVYVIKSLKNSSKHYVGITQNLKKRIDGHNSSKTGYAAKYAPWQEETYITFRNRTLAQEFEKYLKSGSGHAFLKKRLI
ncbi:MAG: GIY-YIG nuclease family protein [Candidatus Omnitrophica bacterium]|nr:GIY-YIG nuclease family protein [Candidatus Omnitrophota bacterium]